MTVPKQETAAEKKTIQVQRAEMAAVGISYERDHGYRFQSDDLLQDDLMIMY